MNPKQLQAARHPVALLRTASAWLLMTATVLPAGTALADAVSDGESFAKARCFTCHNRDRLVVLASKRAPEDRGAHWEKFLPGHNVPAASDRESVIAWLHSVARKP